MNATRKISEHQTKKAAHVAGRAMRNAGRVVFVMSAADALKFLGLVVVGWVVYE